jgi:hypothetical protein
MPPHNVRVSLAAGCWLLAAGSGCAYIPQRAAPANPLPLPAELASYYDYPKRPINATQQLIREHPAFKEFLVQFPLSVSGFEPTEPVVELEWFESKVPGQRPAILFNPILGGDYPLERGICRFFASHGFHVAMIHRKTLKIAPEQDLSQLELLLRQGVLRIRQTVDWMASQEHVDPNRLGSFGLSMGGIASVMAAAVEPRLRVHFVGLAGGSIADILLTSKDSLLTKPLKRYLAHQQLDRATLERLLAEQVKTDPIRLAPYVDSRQLFLLIALADRTIGRTNALRLWRALGRPQVLLLPTGHYTSYFYLPYIKRVSLRFFQRAL